MRITEDRERSWIKEEMTTTGVIERLDEYYESYPNVMRTRGV